MTTHTPRKIPRRSVATQLSKGYRAQGSELETRDIGRTICNGEGFGRVLPIDVGKRIWLKPHGITMENNEQRDARKARQQ